MGLLSSKKTLVQLAPGEYVEVENEIIESVNQQKKKKRSWSVHHNRKPFTPLAI